MQCHAQHVKLGKEEGSVGHPELQRLSQRLTEACCPGDGRAAACGCEEVGESFVLLGLAWLGLARHAAFALPAELSQPQPAVFSLLLFIHPGREQDAVWGLVGGWA